MIKKKKKLSKKKSTRKKTTKKKVKKSKKSIIDNLKIVEKNFLLHHKLSSPMDKAGFLTLSVDFKNKYGAIRYDCLGLTERGLYNVACLIQGRAKDKKSKKKKGARKTAKEETTKGKGKKSPPYTPEEEAWFLEYQIPKVFGEKAEQKLAKDHERAFPHLPRRTSSALAWKLMNLRGRWNPDRKPGVPRKKTTKGKRVIKHRYDPEQEIYLMLRIPTSRGFRHAELKRVARAFNKTFGTEINYKVIGIKCSRLRKKLKGITKAELRQRIAKTDKELRSLSEEDALIVAPSKAVKVSASGKHIVVDTVTNEIIWTGDHKPVNYCVCGGLLQNNSVCTVIIDNVVIQNIFEDHRPVLDYFHK